MMNQWFAVYVSANDAGHARIGMVVAKRLVPGAVGRNRIKRKIREKFRILAQAGSCQDVIVRLRRPFNEAEHPRVFSALNEMLSGILAKE
jgi:ribonuclease P protein component